MPIDPHDDDEKPEPADLGRARRFADFDCPDCNANNPYDDAFGDGDEIRCYYCGQEFEAEVNESGRLRLREI
jgi:hypothetical protein